MATAEDADRRVMHPKRGQTAAQAFRVPDDRWTGALTGPWPLRVAAPFAASRGFPTARAPAVGNRGVSARN